MTKQLNYFYDFYKDDILNGVAPELYIDQEILIKENICLKENNYKVYKINEDLYYDDDRNQNDLLEFYLELKDKSEDYEELVFEIKKNLFFVMINSTIILPRLQWNTIFCDCATRCLVCDLIVEDPNGHIETDNHVVNLDKHKPLKKFNLHITRQIGDIYHCAVCNEVYEKHNNIHLESNRHIERMLFATNRATDSFEDRDNNDKDDKEIKSDSNLDDSISNKRTVRSYASVVKKESKETTTFIEHVIGNKTFAIKYDAYHMILRPNSKEFYCMLCIQFDDVSNTSDHCKSEEHLKKLKQCEIINVHEEHFIRKVTTKYYHCGTCNNLQLVGEIKNHLERHGMKLENETNGIINIEKKQHEPNENSDIRNEKEKTNENNKVSEQNRAQSAQSNCTERSVNLVASNLNMDIILNHFNCNFRVSLMSYNLILNRGVDLYCLLCNVVFPHYILHYKDINHVVRLGNTPFQPYYGINLVRLLNQDAHCAICNIVVNVAVIHLHTSHPTHLFFLNKALYPNNSKPVMNQTNVGVKTERSIEASIHSPSETLKAIPANNSDTLKHARSVDTSKIQMVDLCQTDISSKNLEYEDKLEKEDNLDVFNKYVNLRIKKSVLKVSYMSYHTLVHTGDGNRYCFICSHKITKSLHRHVESKRHLNRMENCKFIINYEKDLLRQVKLTYHCCKCNVLLQKSEIEKHLTWPVHKENNIEKKFRKRIEINTINVEFQLEEESFNKKESQIQLVFKILFGIKKTNNIGGLVMNILQSENSRKVVNISWDAWQGITRFRTNVYCHICKDYFFDIDTHLDEDSHKNIVSKPPEKQFLPACIRKVTPAGLNCVTCNLVIPNKKKNVIQHLTGKKHDEEVEHLLKFAFTDVSST